MQALMSHPDNNINLVTQAEIAKFMNMKDGHCCTAQSFRIDIQGSLRSKWNRSAAIVFANDFVLNHPDYSVDEVQQVWFNFFKSLRTQHQKDESGFRKDRRAKRKIQVRISIHGQHML
jgi:hypothetical protein